MMTQRTPSILLLDDEVMIATTLQAFLQLETAYDVLSFTDPFKALQALEHQRVDCIVSDFMMPGMDGITFLKQARDRWPSTTRILLTGYADKENAIRAINDAGLYYYLEKPWDNDHLKLVIRNGVERSALFNELDARVSALENAHKELHGMRTKLIQAFM
jgi:putative two-component system response regulator